ncbi:hypothetical protein Pfo_015107 [Paulownia fortunei]|nr:hypothetical protein Pfo_015107 [Paulownia fortunei]
MTQTMTNEFVGVRLRIQPKLFPSPRISSLFVDFQDPGNVERCGSSLRLLSSVSAGLCLSQDQSCSLLIMTGMNITAQSIFAARSVMRPHIDFLQC